MNLALTGPHDPHIGPAVDEPVNESKICAFVEAVKRLNVCAHNTYIPVGPTRHAWNSQGQERVLDYCLSTCAGIATRLEVMEIKESVADLTSTDHLPLWCVLSSQTKPRARPSPLVFKKGWSLPDSKWDDFNERVRVNASLAPKTIDGFCEALLSTPARHRSQKVSESSRQNAFISCEEREHLRSLERDERVETDPLTRRQIRRRKWHERRRLRRVRASREVEEACRKGVNINKG